MKKLLFLFSICFILFSCSSDDNDDRKINYIEVENGTATINHNNNEKKVTSDYTIGSNYFSVTNWRKIKYHINRDELKEVENEKDSKIYWYRFHKGSALLVLTN